MYKWLKAFIVNIYKLPIDQQIMLIIIHKSAKIVNSSRAGSRKCETERWTITNEIWVSIY